jgi:NTE family protein
MSGYLPLVAAERRAELMRQAHHHAHLRAHLRARADLTPAPRRPPPGRGRARPGPDAGRPRLDAAAPGTRIPVPVFVVTASGAFLASLDLSIVNVAFPALARSFPLASTATLAWVITAYVVVFAALLITAGRLADRYGRRRVFFTGVGAFAAGSALTALAPSVPLLIGGRVVQGVGAALLVPSSLALLLAACPPSRRSQTVAMWAGVGALAVAVGPSLGAALVTGAGWRSAFFINLPVALAAWWGGRAVLPRDDPAAAAGTPDYGGVALVTAALGALVLAITEGGSWGWTSPRVVAAAAVTATTGTAFVRRCARRSDPVLDLQLLRTRSFSVANAAMAVYAMGFFAVLLGSVLFLTGVWHYSVLEAGLAITPAPVVVAVVAGPAGRAAGRIGFRAVIATGATVFAAGLAWFALRLGTAPDFVGVWLPGMLVVGAGVGLAFPVLGAAAVSELPPTDFAVGSAVNQTARQVGEALGVAIVVAILGAGIAGPTALDHYRHLWLYGAGMELTAGAIGLLLRPALARGPEIMTVR